MAVRATSLVQPSIVPPTLHTELCKFMKGPVMRLTIPITPSEESPPPPIVLELPDDINLNKVRCALRTPVPEAIRPPDEEVFVLTLPPNGGRPPVPGFVRVVSINRSTIHMSDGLVRFQTFDHKSHEMHFDGNRVDFTDRLDRCIAPRSVICGNRVVDVTQIASFHSRPSREIVIGHGTGTDDGPVAA